MSRQPATSSAPRRKFGYGKTFLACIGVGLVVGGVIGLAEALGLRGAPTAYAGGVLLVGLVAMALSLRWWRDADEAVREAHKFSWFWGCSFALVPVGAVAVALYSIGNGAPEGAWGLTAAEAGLVLAGIVGTVLTLLAGYGLCWAGWWLVRSR
jgi:hypothetical protein